MAAAGDLSWSRVGDAGEAIGVSVADTAAGAGAEVGLDEGQDVAVFADAGAVIGLGGNAGRVVTVAVAVEKAADIAVAER